MRLTKKQLAAKEVCLARIKAEQNNGDTECAHGNADDALCDLLEALGMGEVVAEYQEVEKWFA